MIKIIYGLARSGKTARVMDDIAEIVRNAPSSPAVRAALIVPEQYSHSAERLLLRVCGDRLSLSAEVLSFTRLASRAFDELGISSHPLSGGGRLLALYRALSQTRERLSVYGGDVPRAEFLEQLSETLRELKHSCVTPDDLLTSAGASGGQLSAKLRDLALLLSATDAICAQTGAFDASDATLRLSELIDATEFARASLYFDGFNDFTEPEFRVIASLIRCGSDVTLCLTCDNLDDGDDAYETVRQTARRVLAECAKYGRDFEIIKTDGGAELAHPCPDVQLLVAPDAPSECEYAASIIISLVRQGLRWGEIAVMSRDPAPYGRLFRRIAERYGIPVFQSGREDVLNKPPVRFVLAALEVVQSGFDTPDVLEYIKTGLTGLSRAETDALENYVILWGVRAKQWTRLAPWTFGGDEADTGADALRRRLVEPLIALGHALKQSHTCGEKLRALYAFLEETGFAQTLSARSDELRARNEPRLADEYRQLWDVIVGALDEMYAAASEYPLQDKEFLKLLSLVLSQCDVGVIPVALDRVTVGEFTRSRRRDVRALITLGATDESMPKTSEKPGVLSGAERDAAIRAGLPLTDSSDVLSSRELNIIYSALTVPNERLYVIYPEKARPSYVVPLLERACGATVTRLAPEQYLTAAPTPYREYFAVNGGVPAPEALPPLSETSVTSLFGATLKLSATRAESWNSCKYAFFLENGLRVKPRATEQLDAPASGTFVHFALEHAAKLASELGGFAVVDDDFVRESVRGAAQEFAAQRLPGFDDYTERFRYLYARLARDTERVAVDLARELRVSDFAPQSFERRFSVKVTDSLEVTGIVDRVDAWSDGNETFLRVSDYKTGKKAFEISDLYFGLNMQLLIYLHALTDGGTGSTVPSAALYIPARDETVSLPRTASDIEIERELAMKLRRSGLLLDEQNVIDALERGDKRYLPVKMTNGAYTGNALLTREMLARVMRLVMRRMRGVSDGIRTGDVAPKPFYRNVKDHACLYCAYRQACLFGISGRDKPRAVYKLPPDEFWHATESEVAE